MSDQLFNDGEVIEFKGVELECTAVSYQENEEGVRHSYGYTFRPKAEVDAEREAALPEPEEVPQDQKSEQLQNEEAKEA